MLVHDLPPTEGQGLGNDLERHGGSCWYALAWLDWARRSMRPGGLARLT
jgi:hypothetical protein